MRPERYPAGVAESLEIDLRAREKRIYDRLRARLASLQPGGGAGALDLLLFLPDLVVLLLRLAQDSRVPIGAKAIALAGVGYALSPIDLLPELFFGPIGFLDDLVVVAAAVSRVINHVHPDLVKAHWPGHSDVLDVLRRVTLWSESIIGKTMTRLLGFKSV
jgi:uncharacterized membrane protein YkvA (DUF1232 family)